MKKNNKPNAKKKNTKKRQKKICRLTAEFIGKCLESGINLNNPVYYNGLIHDSEVKWKVYLEVERFTKKQEEDYYREA